jgi:hypothetical protein
MRHSLGSDDVSQNTGDSDKELDPRAPAPDTEEQRPSIVASVGSSALGSADIEPAREPETDNDGETNPE